MAKLLKMFHGAKKSQDELDELEWVDFDDDDEYDEEEYEDSEYDEDDEIEAEYEEEYEDGEYDDDEEDDEYYEDDEYDDDEEDDEYYEDDEYDEDEEDYEDDDYDDDLTGVRGVIYKLTHLPAADYMVALTGVAVLVLAVFTGALYLNAKNSQKQVETFAEIGVGLEDISVVGEKGLLAIADAQAAKLLVADMMDDEENLDEFAENADGKIEVILDMTSIQKDLKIKFINKESGKLISNIAFEVEIEKPSGEIYSKKDDDKDGIIYQKDMAAGKYKVKLIAPSSDDKYKISSEKIAITVRDTIEYKKVDVSNEVKTEAQVNVAVEDTKINEVAVESTNTDTVEWVESTKTLVSGTEKTEESYEVVESKKIADPSLKTAVGFRLLDEEPTPTPTPTLEPTADPTQAPTADPTQAPASDPTATPTANPTQTPTALPTQAPTATPTVKPSISPTPSVKPSISPTPSVKPSTSPTPSAKPTVTPTATPNKAATDRTSNLKTTDGEQLFIKDSNGKFIEAKYADFYDKNIKEFYRKKSKVTGEYKYTGWQEIDGATYFFNKDGNKVTGEQVIQGAKYNFNSDGSLNKGSGNLGIDVSKWNGSIDWNAVKNSGVSYVIIRCGYRGSTTGAMIEDPTFRTNIQGATKAGLKVGVYFFTQAVNEVEAVEEASMVLGLIKGYNISYPVFLDVESSGGRADGINSGTRTAVCKAFCQTIQNSGYKAGIYANKTWFNSYMDTTSLTGYKIWLAQYAASPSYTRTRYDMWQYSSKGSVSGISGNVDMNISYMGY